MLSSYQDIPKYAEVLYLGDIRDSGYLCSLVQYKGILYKPLEKDVVSESNIQDRLNAAKKYIELANNTINKK